MKGKKIMKSVLIIAAILAVVAGGVAVLRNNGGSGDRYSIEYGNKGLYNGAKDSYKAGQTVTLRFPYVATDTSYGFYLNGVPIDKTYSDMGGYKLTFVMPPYDAKLECVTRNDMAYVRPEEEITESLLYEYYKGTALATDGKSETYTIALYSISETDSDGNTEGRSEIRVSKTNVDGTTEENVYDAKRYGSYECDEVAKEYYMHGWDTMKNTISETGMIVRVKFNTATGYITVSNGCMPENGREGMNKIRAILEGYINQ